MFSGKSSKNEIRLHKRVLKMLLDDTGSTFEELLQKRGEHTIHTRNIQTLLFEVYKCLSSKSPSFLWNFFECRPTSYNLRINDLLQLTSTRAVRYGLNSLKLRGSMLWNTLPYRTKSAKNDRLFKNKIEKWTGFTCYCIVCR